MKIDRSPQYEESGLFLFLPKIRSLRSRSFSVIKDFWGSKCEYTVCAIELECNVNLSEQYAYFYLLLKFYEKSILLIFSFLISYFFFCFFLFCFEVLPYFCTGIGKKDK